MKLASFRRLDGSAGWGVVSGSGLVDCTAIAPTLRQGLTRLAAVRDAAGRQPDVQLDAVTLLPPIPDPEKILCVGLNYMSHILEGGRPPPEKPIIFVRFPNSQVGHGTAIVAPRVSDNFDYEAELAVVIGKTCRHVAKADWESVVAGYSCYNDGSIRDWQRHSGQFTPGKNFYHSGAFGPYLVTRDEIADVRQCTLLCRVNGETRQEAPVSDLCFDIPTLIEYCSTFTQLEPGDVIVTGTTGGVGAYFKPPKWLKPGDTVEVEITGVGVLRNPVVAEG